MAPRGAAASTPAVEVISPPVPDRYAEAAADEVTWVIAAFSSSPSVPLAPPVFAYSGRRLGSSEGSAGRTPPTGPISAASLDWKIASTFGSVACSYSW